MNTTTAAQDFTTATATIARSLVAQGFSPEVAAVTATDWLIAKMVTERPEMAARVIRSAVAA